MSTGQRVRVTIEGTRTPGDPDPVLRLRTDEGALVYVPRNDRGVTLEDVTPARVWTDGDVILSDVTGLAWTRHDGTWQTPGAPTRARDRAMSELATEGAIAVLRYQAGE